MKLESEPGFAQTPSRKSYNPFDSDNEDTDVYIENKINPYDISFEKNADHEALSFQLENGDISWEQAILGTTISADENGEVTPFRKDTQLFTDKTITECDLPELMVCYKENVYHNVKDIVIDEGVPTKVSFAETFNGDINGDLSLENESQTRPLNRDQVEEDSMKYSEFGKDSERKNLSNQCGDSVEIDGLKHDLSKEVADSIFQSEGDKKMVGDMVCDRKDRQESETEEMNLTKVEKMMLGSEDHQLSKTDEVSYAKEDKKVNGVSDDEHGKDGAYPTKVSVMDDASVDIEPTTDPEEPTVPQSSELPSSKESADSSVPNDLSYNSKVENGSIILDFNSSQAIPVKEDDKEKKAKQNVEAEKPRKSDNVSVEKPPRPQTMSRHDERAPGVDKGVNGEMSFSADMPPPASITYMGPNARCGSISLRSESSTGSTRSFAFPVLQGEWNSSPVRMAKAEERNLHKHRGWVHSVMCCRF